MATAASSIAAEAGLPHPTTAITTGLTMALDLGPILDLATSLEESSGRVTGVTSDLTAIIDPALLQALGELGLNESLASIGAAEAAADITLNAEEGRRRLNRRFAEEQEDVGANLSARGIFIEPSSADTGLVGDTARRLGERQGERMADFEAGVADSLRAVLTSLGSTGLENLSSLGGTTQGAVGRELQGGLDRQRTMFETLGY